MPTKYLAPLRAISARGATPSSAQQLLRMHRQHPETACSRSHKLTWHAANTVVANTVRAGGAEGGV